MNRALILCLVLAVCTLATASAQSPQALLPPSPAASLARTTSATESSSAISAGVPRLADSESKDVKTGEAQPEKVDPAAMPPRNTLEEALNLKPTFQLRGRVEAEATMAAQSAQSIATLGNLQNGFGFRRVRLGAQGTIGDAASWVSEVELAGGSVRLRDVFVGVDALTWVRQLRIGYFREPYSLDGMTSSNFMTFLERSPLNVISPARNWGVCGFWWPENERLLFTMGVFRDGTGSNGQSIGDGNNQAYTVRLTGLPIYEPDGPEFRLVHVGGAFSQRVPPNGVITFTRGAGSNLLTVEDNPGSPFLPTVDIPATNYQYYNLQAAWVRGPLSLQSEWQAAAIHQTSAGLAFVHGVYICGSYFLTGEHRGYNRTRGSFDQVDVLHPFIRARDDPRGGFGAVELTARFSYFNFDAPNLPADAIGNPVGTLLYELTLGVNWYLNSYTRIMFNYTAGMPDKVGFEPTSAHVFGVRAAIYW